MQKLLTDSSKLIALQFSLLNHTAELRNAVDALLADDKQQATRILGRAVKHLEKSLREQLPAEALKKLEALDRAKPRRKYADVDAANRRSLNSLKAFMSAARKSGVVAAQSKGGKA